MKPKKPKNAPEQASFLKETIQTFKRPKPEPYTRCMVRKLSLEDWRGTWRVSYGYRAGYLNWARDLVAEGRCDTFILLCPFGAKLFTIENVK